MASQYDLPYTGNQVETLLGKVSDLEDEMPHKTSDLVNDSGFITQANVPTNVSQLTNDSGFITNAPVISEQQRAQGVEQGLAQRMTSVEGKIPSSASSNNKLADQNFVNSSIATNTATYISYNGEPFPSVADLNSYAGPHDNNDYAFVVSTDAAGNTVYSRYKYNGSTWAKEYDLNNSSFTSAQWTAINSLMTAAKTQKLDALPTASELEALFSGKQDVIADLATIRAQAAAAYVKPSGGIPASDIAEGVIPDVSGKVNTSDIADNLTTNDATKVLSAKQGKVLNENLTQLGQEIYGEIDLGQWEVGSIGYSGGKIVNSASTSRVRCAQKTVTREGYYTLSCKSGFQFAILIVNKVISVTWVSSFRMYLFAGDVYRIALREDPVGDYSGYTQGQIDALVVSSGIILTTDGTSDIIEELPIDYCTKTSTRTANLFNCNDKRYEGRVIGNDGVWSSNAQLNTVAIPLEAGKTYYKYNANGVKSNWGGLSVRIFAGDGSFVTSTTEDTIVVPAGVSNPIGYFRYYNDGTVGDYTKYMVLENGVDSSAFIPYYDVTYEQYLVDYINGKIKDTTGQGTTVTMSQKAISDELADLADAIGTVQHRFAERPASGYENFLVNVDVAISNTSTTGQESADSPSIQQDRCILKLPESYSRSGEPTRLVIVGHGTGWTCTAETTSVFGVIYPPTLLAEGYALLGWNGTPGDINGLANGNNGTPQCYRSLLAAYKYVIEKYNIARDGVLTIGYSMGTIMTGQIACFSDIPILAQVFFSASFELMKSQFTLKPAVRQRMCQLFGFVGTAPTFTQSNPPSQDEIDYVLANYDKWAGYDPLINGYVGKAIDTFNEWPASSAASDASEALLYADKALIRRIPTKLIYCADDTTASPRWSKYMAQMMRNAGCYVEVREYATGGHDSINAGTYTSGIPGAQYEAMVFLRRFNH